MENKLKISERQVYVNMNSPIQLLNRISAACILLFCFVPPIQVDSIYRIIAIAASVVWAGTELMISGGKISKKVLKFIGLSCACVVLMFVARTNISTISTAFANVLQPIIIILVALISMYSFEYDIKFFNIMLPIVLVLICFYCNTTIESAIDNPYASRIANSEWLEERFEDNKNVGLYGYIYMCVFLVPILVYKIVRKIHINKLVDILSYIVLAFIIVMVAVSGYMIAIFCTILGIVMAILLNKITKKRIFVVICIGILLWINQEQIINNALGFIAQIIGDNPVYNDKLDGFILLYEEGELGDSSWGGRISNYMDSLKMIMTYPVLGAYYWGSEGGGGHSTILDTIGRFGWITAILYFKIMWEYPRRLVAGVSKNYPLYIIVLILMIIFGVLDPYCQELALPLFFVMPYIAYLEKGE